MDTNGAVSNFDYTCEIANHYFKSSFARSMAFSNSNQSKSLDYVYFDRPTINEESESDNLNQKVTADDSAVGVKGYSPLSRRSFGAPAFNNHQFTTASEFNKTNCKNGNKSNDALKLWNMKKETIKREEETKENNHFHNHIQQQIEDNNCNELIRLRKECQSLMEENRRLHLEKRPSPLHSPTMDLTYLQSQVDTLQWQLKQAESSRQMYRAVLEQVSRVLDRVHKNLDHVYGTKTYNSKGKSGRVPRSRSVHTVATPTSHSRPSSPSPSSQSYVHRASSIAQMQESHSYATLRDNWRAPRAAVEEVPVEKLSQEAFRMLRTVQSLLGTREPDLAHRLTPTPTPATSNSETLNDSGSERRDSTSVGSCSSLLQSSCGGIRKSLDASSINSCSSRATTQCTGDEVESKPSTTPQMTEDESGFSSMSSFHEVGLPECRTYPELGLPIVEPNHRRWSSTPVDSQYHSSGTFCAPGETIRVLWV